MPCLATQANVAMILSGIEIYSERILIWRVRLREMETNNPTQYRTIVYFQLP